MGGGLLLEFCSPAITPMSWETKKMQREREREKSVFVRENDVGCYFSTEVAE